MNGREVSSSSPMASIEASAWAAPEPPARRERPQRVAGARLRLPRPTYEEPASPKGVPSASRQLTHCSPGWTISPPSAHTRSTAAARSATGKYGSEKRSPGPGPRSCNPKTIPSYSVCQPLPSSSRRLSSVTSSNSCQKCRARSGSSAGSSIRNPDINTHTLPATRGVVAPSAPHHERAGVRTFSRLVSPPLRASRLRLSHAGNAQKNCLQPPEIPGSFSDAFGLCRSRAGSPISQGVYAPSVAIAPSWSQIASSLAIHFGQPVRLAEPLGVARRGRAVRAIEAARLGDLVVKVRRGDRADEKTKWYATHLPLLIARGYPAPEVIWHGFVDDDWYAIVQRRVPGTPLESLNTPLLDELLGLVELQADAGIEPGVRDFASYVTNVLFDGWDHVW